MIAKTAKKLAALCALAIVFLVFSSTSAFATHFRYGTIRWRIPNAAQPNVVEFSVELAFRASFFAYPSPGTVVTTGYTLDITNAATAVLFTQAPLNLTVVSEDVAHDWFVGTQVITVTLPAANATYKAAFSNCCRISTLQDNNHDQNFSVWTTVPIDMTDLTPNRPPVSASLPIVVFANNTLNTRQIPASDPDGDPITFRLATSVESGLVATRPQPAQLPPAAFTLSPAGLITWTPSSAICNPNPDPTDPLDPADPNGCAYAVQVVMTDSHGASTVLDFILLVINATGTAPTLKLNGSATAISLTVPVGFALTMPIAAQDPDPAKGTVSTPAPITIGAGGLPIGSTTIPSLPTTLTPAVVNGLVNATFTWTPTYADVGAHVLIFSATDDQGLQTTNSATVNVSVNAGLYLTGVLRDFPAGTADFGKTVDGDNGPVSLVLSGLAASGEPVFNGAAHSTTIANFPNWWSGGVAQPFTVVLSNATSANPAVYSLNSNSFGAGHTYFTYEEHTYYTYNAGDVLHYSSSDDMWVFINGGLAADMGGVHATARTATVSVDAIAGQFLLLPGSTYRLDIFYAHRSAVHGASIGLEDTKPSICDPLSPLAPVAASTAVRAGTATYNAGTNHLVLVNSTQALQAGLARMTTPTIVGNGFATEFDFSITVPQTSSGAEGFAFGLFPTAVGSVGGTGASLGYVGTGATVAVEFDTTTDVANTDPLYQQVSIHAATAGLSSASESASVGASGNLIDAVVGTPLSLTTGTVHHARIEYVRGTNLMRVFVDNSPAPIATASINLAQFSPGAGPVYLGFTSSNGPSPLTATVEVFNWTVTTVDASAGVSSLTFMPLTQLPGTPGSVRLQLRDACQVPLRIGGSGSEIAATLATSDSYTTPVSVTDNLDGTYGLSYTPPVGGAPWTLSVLYGGTPILNSPFNFVVLPADPAVTSAGGTFVYNAQPHAGSGAATGVLSEALTPLTLAYSGSASAPVHGGTYDVVATFAGNAHYNAKSSVATPLTITPIAVPTFTVADTAFTYDGAPHAATTTIAGIGGEAIASPAVGLTYNLDPAVPVDAGHYAAAASFGGNSDYTSATANGSVTIGKANTSVTVIGASLTYDGAVHPSSATVSVAGGGAIPSAVTTIAYNGGVAAPLNAGTYNVIANFAGTNNYAASTGSAQTVITQATPTLTVTGGASAYDAAAHPSVATATGVLGEALTPVSILYNGAAAPPIDAATYAVTASLAASQNYAAASAVNTTTITPVTPTVSVTGGTFIYDATAHSSTGTVTGVGGVALGSPSITYNGGLDAPLSAGSYGVVGHYAGSQNYVAADGANTTVIGQATPTVTVTGGSFTYDGASHASTGNVAGVGGVSLGAPVITYNGGATVPLVAGSYVVVGSFTGDVNYTSATGTTTTTIGKATQALTWSAPAAIVYGTALSAAQLNAASSAAGTFVYSPANGVLGAGPHSLSVTFTPTDATDYAPATANVTVTVVPAPLTIAANNAMKVYGAAVPPLSASASGFVNGDSIASLATPPVLSTGATPASNAGTYPIVVGGASSPNYAIVFVNGAVTVTQAPLTITANAVTMAQGAAVPALTASYSGFVNGDTVASLDVPVSLTTTATASSPAGTYPIVASAAADANYAIAFVNGTLTVTPVTSLKSEKQAVRQLLTTLIPGASRETANAIRTAIADIDRSLDASLWLDGSHLTKKGESVFDAEGDAVGELMDIRNASAAIRQGIDRLVTVDRGLAQIAITQAAAAHGNPFELLLAQIEMTQGDFRRGLGLSDFAVQEYGEAWHHAQRAMNVRVDTDGHDHDHNRCDRRSR
jgi:fibro-slime domain-containing protein